MDLTDPVISLLVQVPIGIAVLVVLFVYMRQTAAERKQAADLMKQEREQAAKDRAQMLLMMSHDSDRFQTLSGTLTHQSEILQGFPPFMKGLVDNVRDFSIDTTTAVKVEANRTIESQERIKTAMLTAVSAVPDVSVAKVEPVVKGALDDAVSRSISNQDANHHILLGGIEALRLSMQQSRDQLDRVILKLEGQPGMSQHNEIIEELEDIKAGLNILKPAPPPLDLVATQAAALKRKTEPIPPMPPLPADGSDTAVTAPFPLSEEKPQ